MQNKRIIKAISGILLAALLLVNGTACLSISLPGVGGSGTQAVASGCYLDGRRVELITPERESLSYAEMSEEEKNLYCSAYTVLLRGRSEFVLKNVDYQNVLDIYGDTMLALLNDCPEFFWLNGYVRAKAEYVEDSKTGNVTISFDVFDYWKDKNLNDARREFNSALISITNRVSRIDGDYERVKFLHDYIISKVTYDEEAYREGDAADEKTQALPYTAYGALLEGKALCGGYAKLFELVMHRLGYDCEYVTGTAGGGPHAWNLIRLDGDYYYIDLTWDDNDEGFASYTYFCVNDEVLRRTHTIDSEYPSAKATATKFNYHVAEGLYVKQYGLKLVEDMIKGHATDPSVSLRFVTEEDMEKAIGDLIDGKKINEILATVNKTSYSYMVNRDQFVLLFIIE
jgi:hypothetical protein